MKARVTVLLLGIYSGLYSQSSHTGNWFIYQGSNPINTKLIWHNEVQYRNYNLAGDLEQLLLRTGIGYNLSEKNNNVLLGYGFIKSDPYVMGTNTKTSNTEHRIFQQLITKQNFGRFFIQHRYRIEERFLKEGFKTRFRYFLSVNIPVNQKVMGKNAVYVSMYNELFINGKAASLFDRNRLYGALGYGLSDFVRVELGVMRQSLQNTGSRTQFQVVLFNQLPF